jgi:predicted regulator of Ras-like GTPase activity (Roadblock/LC7/MglB family)
MLGRVDAAQAIAELTDISPQVREVAVIAADSSVAGTNLADDGRATALAAGGRRLAEAADALRAERSLGPVSQLEAATVAGSVFVVRDGDRAIVATTTPKPTVGLVFYDLKTCLRSIEEPEPEKPKPRRRAANKTDDAAA